MTLLNLAWKSLLNRGWTSLLTVLSIALSSALLLSVAKTRTAAEEGFTQTISQTDLIVGARTGPINLILYAVFNMGSASNNISYETYEDLKNNPAVEWTIPYSLGDGHRGFRVVGTDDNFYEHYRFRGNQSVEFVSGSKSVVMWDVVLGSAVAQELNYKLGDKIVVAHGVTKGEGILQHDDKPFHVVGILQATGTVLDRSLYITLKGLEAIHLDWKDGAMPARGKEIAADSIQENQVKVQQITAFFVRLKNRIEVLKLQREINTYSQEPLLAIIPGVTLSEIWRSLGYVEQVLKLISWLVVAVGLVAMLIALLTSLEARRREMSILRALGGSPSLIFGLLLLESTLLTIAGVAAGILVNFLTLGFLRSWIEREFGFYFSATFFNWTEFWPLLVMVGLGAVVGVIPALRAMNSALKDGLSSKI